MLFASCAIIEGNHCQKEVLLNRKKFTDGDNNYVRIITGIKFDRTDDVCGTRIRI